MTVFTNLITFFIFIVTLISTVSSQYFDLELVQVLFRHGDRVPTQAEIYKNDPYDPWAYESIGYGQLTKIGKIREYRIGQMLRQRYNNFLGDFKIDEVYAYSTDVDRTKMSLQLLLAALYPPTKNTSIIQNLNWIPIPTHYNKPADDIFFTDLFGGLANQMIKNVSNIPEVKKFYSKYATFIRELERKTGSKFSRPFSTLLVNSNIHCILSMGLPLPNWCTQEDFKKLQELSDFSFKLLSYTDEMKKILVGSALNELLKNIENNENKTDKKKIYLYSTHDIHMAAYGRTQNFTNMPSNPAFGSAIIIEKLRGRDNKVYIQTLYWTGIGEQLFPLKLQSLSDYVKFNTKLAVTNEELMHKTVSSCTRKGRTLEIKDEEALIANLLCKTDLYSFKYPESVMIS